MGDDTRTSNPQNRWMLEESDDQAIQNQDDNNTSSNSVDQENSNNISDPNTGNQNAENTVTQVSTNEDTGTPIDSSDMSGKSTPESGSYLVCNGATCKCEFGDTLVEIKIISQNKIFINDASATQKLVATIKDNVFPPPFFGRCRQNPSSGKPCVYSPKSWEILGNTEDHPEITSQPVLTENSYIQCDRFQGKITIVTHGQEISVDSDSIDQLDEAEILAINCFFEPIEADDDIQKARVDSIEYNNQKSGNTELIKVRMNREALFKANYGLDKRNISWQLWQKTESLDRNDETSFIYKQQGEELKLFFPKEGSFSLEAFGAFLDERSQIWDNCVLKFEVVDKNEITQIKSSSGNLYISDSSITLIRKKTYLFTVESLFPFEEDELETLSAQMKEGRGSLISSSAFTQNKELITFTPLNIGNYTLLITFGTENTVSRFNINAVSNEVVDVQTEPGNIHDIRPNEDVTFVLKLKEDIESDKNDIKWFIKEPLKTTTQPVKGGISITRKFSRPGKVQVGAVLDNENPIGSFFRRLISIVNTIKMPSNTYDLTVKNNSITSVSFDGLSENIKGYPANKIALDIQTQMPYNLSLDGGFIITIQDITPDDFEQTKVESLGFWNEDIIQIEEISETKTLEGEKGFWETVFFKDPTNWSKKFYTNKLNFIFNKTGKYKVSIVLSHNPSQVVTKEITIDESEIIKWYFADEVGNRYSEIGWYQLVYLQIEAKGWANKSGYLGLYWDKDWDTDPLVDSVDLSNSYTFDKDGKVSIPLYTFTWIRLQELINKKTPGKEKLYFEIGGIDTVCKNWKKDKTRKLSDGKEIEQYKLDESKSTGEFLKNTVTIVDKTKIKAYFADDEGVLLKRIIKYGEPLKIIGQILLSKEESYNRQDLESRYRMNIFENTKATSKNKEDRRPDLYIHNKERTSTNLIVIKGLDEENKFFYDANTNFGLLSEDLHKQIPAHQPRCFYLVIYDSQKEENGKIKAIYQYPEQYGTNEDNDRYLVDTLLDINDETSTNEWYEKWLTEKPGKTKEDWNNYVLSIQHIRTNYFLQLKIAKDTKMNYSYPETRPVLIGEGTNVEKGYIPGNCPRCNDPVTFEQLKQIFPDASDNKLKTVAEVYTNCMRKLEMNTCWNKAHFMAQMAIETGSVLDVKEGELIRYTRQNCLDIFPSKFFEGKWKDDGNWKSEEDPNETSDTQKRKFAPGRKERLDAVYAMPSGEEKKKAIANLVYANKNGNGDENSGDGWAFRGSGPVQLTGRANFKKVYDLVKEYLDDVDIMTDPDSVRKDFKIAIITSMGYFKAFGVNKNANGADTHDKIEIVCSGIGHDVPHGDSTNHTLKEKFFKEKSSKLFRTEDCLWNKVSFIDCDIITYHTYSDRHIEKHVPKEGKNKYPNKRKYIYHDKDGNICEVGILDCTEIPFMTHKKGTVSVQTGHSRIWEHTRDTSIDADKSYYYNNSEGKLEKVIVTPKEGSKIYLYEAHKSDKRILVKMPSIIQIKDTKDTIIGSYEFIATERLYAGEAQFAAFVGMLVEFGIPWQGTGNTHVDGTGYPSVTHVNGCSFDFRYSHQMSGVSENHDQKLIDTMYNWGYEPIYIGKDTKKIPISYTHAKRIDGHNDHIHCGPLTDVKIQIVNE